MLLSVLDPLVLLCLAGSLRIKRFTPGARLGSLIPHVIFSTCTAVLLACT